MQEAYPKNAKSARPERRGVSRRRVIDEAKAKVLTGGLAERLCAEQGKTLRRAGSELLTNCLIPDHEDRTPSFTVNLDKNLWYCHGCVRGGDVVELARYTWGYSRAEVAMAAANLLYEFGNEIPARPSSWFAKQAHQKPLRDALEEIRFRSLRRRVFCILKPIVAGIADDEERKREAEYLWAEVTSLAVRMIAERRNG